jgi:hypothetical protein
MEHKGSLLYTWDLDSEPANNILPCESMSNKRFSDSQSLTPTTRITDVCHKYKNTYTLDYLPHIRVGEVAALLAFLYSSRDVWRHVSTIFLGGIHY